MTSVSRATLEVYVEWGSFAAGSLAIATNDADATVGSIATDDADIAAGVLQADDWTASFAGAYDNVSARVATATIERGRDDLFTEMLAGTANLSLRDPDGIFNHANALSPLYGLIDDRLHPVLIKLTRAGVTRARFYGLTRRVTWQPTGRKGTASIECVDLFYYLQRARPVIAATGATTTGAAIALILNAIQWIDPSARVLATGDPIPDFSADGSRTALELIGELLEAERGVFYVDGTGRAIYEDRYARELRPVETTIVDRMTHLAPEVDFDLIRNRVRVTRLDAAGVEIYTAEAVDADSVSRFGYSDFPEIQTTYLASNAAADALAAGILPLVVLPSSPIREFTVDGRDPDLLDAILDLDLLDRFQLQELEGGTVAGVHVERFKITVTGGGRVAGEYLLSPASDFGLLLIATDDADVTSGSIATDDADVAAGTLVY